MDKVIETLRDFLAAADESLLRRPGLVAVSGGADSMALLEGLREVSGPFGLSLRVVHFNHQLRGRESDEDEAFVELAATRHGLGIHIGQEDVRALARKRGESIEMAARHARYRFFAAAALEAGAGVVFLGHHQDDQIELFFLRLLRGASPGGLAGMRPWSDCPGSPRLRLARPLLKVTRQELRDYLEKRNVPWRDDSSNESLDPARNRLRADLLPAIRGQYQPALSDVIGRLMRLIQDDEALFAEMLREQEGQSRMPFDDWPPSLQRRWVAGELKRLNIEPGLALIEALRGSVGKRVSIGHQAWAIRDEDGRVERSGSIGDWNGEVSGPFSSGGGMYARGALEVRWSIQEGGYDPGLWASQDGCMWLDADKVGDTVLFRHWKPGDRFQPIGMEGKPKLQDLFVNAKVPVEERRRRAVAVDAKGEIFWVEGFRMAEAFKLDKESKRRLKWSWRRI